MKMIKLYFAGQISNKLFHNYGENHAGNVYLNSRHLKPISHRNDFTTIYTIHPDTFRTYFEFDATNRRWQIKSHCDRLGIYKSVNLDNIYLKKEYIRNF